MTIFVVVVATVCIQCAVLLSSSPVDAFAPHGLRPYSYTPTSKSSRINLQQQLKQQQQQQQRLPLSGGTTTLSLFWQNDNDSSSTAVSTPSSDRTSGNDDNSYDDISEFFSRFITNDANTKPLSSSSTKKTTTTSQSGGNGGGRTSQILLQAQTALAPAAEIMQEKTDGWALSYADLTPESEETFVGQAFLATNIAYAMGGALLSVQGEPALACLLEIVSVASFAYHYCQLAAPYNRTEESTVQLALMVDYIFAFSSIILGLIYLLTDQTLPPIEGIASAVAGITCLLACWKWEKGLPYIYLHSLWHIFSAISGYIVGTAHLS
eukprot:CAMPEP_0113468352 /NCGR_PEP_ID=MMETSP0014_2-20120614/15309_1 /TAXON_ID=2857 /ORGANISM="Nitzschia sp." /LENGTH=322 /DNA_ID=CAMNT_0000360735 /DNA_START=101 /DNA_END=1065 /DNA_ORIENTATION=+ /assembly_acc=CAM_ASM_000159